MTIDATRRAAIEQIRALPAQLRDLISGLTEEQLTTHFLEHEWTVAQNVHHLADSHMNSFIRIRLIQTEERPVLRPYDQDSWALLDTTAGEALEDSLRLLEGLHRRWVRAFETMRDDEWDRVGFHPENGEVSINDLLFTYAQHGLGHLDQISRTLAAQPDAS